MKRLLYILFIACSVSFGTTIATSAQDNQTSTHAQRVSYWLSKIQEMATWYHYNIHGYSHQAKYPCPIIDRNVRNDCSGLTTACLISAGLYDGDKIYKSGDFRKPNGVFGRILRKHFTPIEGIFMQRDSAKFFRPGDILVGYSCKGDTIEYEHGHVTIYAGNGRFFDWGMKAYTASSQPISGDPTNKVMYDHIFNVIWRLK